MSGLLINPGTGPVPDATAGQAAKNMVALLDAAGAADATFSPVLFAGCGDGRWRYTVRHNDKSVEVAMPGIPLDRLRDTGTAFVPRLYVDESSWVWSRGVDMLRELLTGGE